MNGKNGQAFLVQNVDPESCQGEIDEGKEEINPGQNSFTGGEIIAAGGRALALQVVHGRADGHRNFELREAIGEDQCVLVGGRDVVVLGEGDGAGGDGVESEDELDGVGLEDTGNLGVGDLLEDVNPSVAGAKEETQFGEVAIVGVQGEGDGRAVELEAATGSEAELVEGDD